jgi:hypothetical protein
VLPEEAGAGATATAAAELPSKELMLVPFKKHIAKIFFCHNTLNGKKKRL